MPVLDRREPGVYVSIEDASYVAPALEVGRVGYIVGLCPKGPSNQVVKVTSLNQYYQLFGKPDYRRYSQSCYNAVKFLQYSSNLLFVRVTPEDAYWSNNKIVKSVSTTTYGDVATGDTASFTEGSNEVICATNVIYDAISVGDWIVPTGISTDDAVQVINKTDDGGIYKLILDRAWGSSVADTTVDVVVIYTTQAIASMNTSSQMPETDTDLVYGFYAVGAGTYYNNLVLKGTRNTDYEKMFVDSDGNVLYKYLFMDIALYEKNPDGTEKLLEGPWTVSLIPRDPASGNVIRDLASGVVLFIEDVINNNSKYIKCVAGNIAIEDLITATDAEDNRLQVMLLLSSGSPIGTNNIAKGGIQLKEGTDGTGMYDQSGNLVPDAALYGRCQLAYAGMLESVDGSIEQMREVTYPWYKPDYIVTGGFPATVQDGGRQLSEYREDCITLADTGGLKTNYSQDLDARLNDVPWNTWTAALYVQYREIQDPFTGKKIWINPVYHAVERHLFVDGAYFIGEPVANIEKGAIQEKIKLAYRANHTERGDLIDAGLNPVIVEPEGKYILSQRTTWKRLSVLRQLHVAKFIAYLRKMIPPLLKDILQRKATQFWINQAKFRVNYFLNNFVEKPGSERYSILKSFNVNVVFDDVQSELNVLIDVTPIRAIERINVVIIVH